MKTDKLMAVLAKWSQENLIHGVQEVKGRARLADSYFNEGKVSDYYSIHWIDFRCRINEDDGSKKWIDVRIAVRSVCYEIVIDDRRKVVDLGADESLLESLKEHLQISNERKES